VRLHRPASHSQQIVQVGASFGGAFFSGLPITLLFLSGTCFHSDFLFSSALLSKTLKKLLNAAMKKQ